MTRPTVSPSRLKFSLKLKILSLVLYHLSGSMEWEWKGIFFLWRSGSTVDVLPWLAYGNKVRFNPFMIHSVLSNENKSEGFPLIQKKTILILWVFGKGVFSLCSSFGYIPNHLPVSVDYPDSVKVRPRTDCFHKALMSFFSLFSFFLP